MSYTISIYNSSAVLYDGAAAVAAAAGDRRALARFIDECCNECGENLRVYGEHRLAVMREEKKQERKRTRAQQDMPLKKAA
jgi:hypothetical protein